MARTQYKGKIFIDGDGQYVRDVTAQLDAVNGRRTGRAVLKAIQAKVFKLVIQPWTRKEPGAWTHGSRAEGSTDFERSSPKGQPTLTCGRGTSGWTQPDKNGQPTLGLGGGSDQIMDYSPDVTARIEGPGHESDEILIHELVHTLRRMLGLNRCVGVREGFDNIEEFLAILITNIYRSECRRTGLRGDHSFDDCPSPARGAVKKCLKPMTPALSDPTAFYQHYKLLMERLFGEMAALGKEIAVYVNCDFNPLYEYGRWHWGLPTKLNPTR